MLGPKHLDQESLHEGDIFEICHRGSPRLQDEILDGLPLIYGNHPEPTLFA
ncbi:MAG: hypothetical protein ACR2NG_00890 [Acidimicrobiia bacterium]